MRIVAGLFPDQIGDDNRLALGRERSPEQLLKAGHHSRSTRDYDLIHE
jgi:hypothetical protein